MTGTAITATEPPPFVEIARALDELGFTNQELANAELLAERLQREAGFSPVAAEYAVLRMRRRNEVLTEGQRFFTRAAKVEILIRLLTKESPPPWRAILAVSWSLIRLRLRGSDAS
jgi:hypothetical protein